MVVVKFGGRDDGWCASSIGIIAWSAGGRASPPSANISLTAYHRGMASARGLRPTSRGGIHESHKFCGPELAYHTGGPCRRRTPTCEHPRSEMAASVNGCRHCRPAGKQYVALA